MSEITVKDVTKLADLIRIAVTDEEAALYTELIAERLEFADKLSELNTNDVPPTTHGNDITGVMRQDIPALSISQEEALGNAPDKQEGHFKVPSIMD